MTLYIRQPFKSEFNAPHPGQGQIRRLAPRRKQKKPRPVSLPAPWSYEIEKDTWASFLFDEFDFSEATKALLPGDELNRLLSCPTENMLILIVNSRAFEFRYAELEIVLGDPFDYDHRKLTYDLSWSQNARLGWWIWNSHCKILGIRRIQDYGVRLMLDLNFFYCFLMSNKVETSEFPAEVMQLICEYVGCSHFQVSIDILFGFSLFQQDVSYWNIDDEHERIYLGGELVDEEILDPYHGHLGRPGYGYLPL